jgi:RNA-directed DNA polymerase
MSESRCYPIHASPLYAIGSKARLCRLLGIHVSDLRMLLAQQNYREWQTRQKLADQLAQMPAKPRGIQEPKPLLRLLHRRLAALLNRIEKPDFLHSARKGFSYLSNAVQHQHGESAVRVDIKSFYPSVRQRLIKRFFEEQLRMAADVAHTLAKLCCKDEGLPTGSPLSPILSYFACSALFTRIAAIADRFDLNFTLYVDDMVFSGRGANRQFAHRIKRELAREGLTGHKVAYFSPQTPKVITGVAVHEDHIEVPFKRQRRMRRFEEAFASMSRPEDAAVLAKALLGQYREAERLQAGSRLRARPIEAWLAANKFAVPVGKTKRACRKRLKKPSGRPITHKIAEMAAVLRKGIAAARSEQTMRTEVNAALIAGG